jgi:ribosomal protein S18 acetylase RimI-like enzyme
MAEAPAAMRLEPASRYSHAELAEIFTAAYEGYFTPFVLDEAGFRFMSTTYDDDLDASRVAVVEGEPAGICKLAIRGDRGWIGGVGVAPPHRGKGIGETLMRAAIDQARSRGLRELWLEVLFPNEPAIRLYEKLYFEPIRVLEVWTLDGWERRGTAQAVAVTQARARIQRERREREPWQRADESVAHLEDVEALESDRSALLFRRTGERVSLLQGVAMDEAAARALLRSLPEATSLSWLNGPEGDPFNAAVESLGGTLAWRQHEMLLRLAD